MEIRNHEYYVSLEVAKLLKKLGFDWDTYNAYNKDGVFANKNRNLITWNHFSDYYPAPTLEVAQRWLREVKKIHIEITFGGKWIYTPYNLTNLECLLSEDEFPETRNYHTYEEAFEAGIKKVLEIILKKGE